jgi:hypothetical protein
MISEEKQAFIDFAQKNASEQAPYTLAALADKKTAQRIAAFDPRLATLIEKTVDARLEVARYLRLKVEK